MNLSNNDIDAIRYVVTGLSIVLCVAVVIISITICEIRGGGTKK